MSTRFSLRDAQLQPGEATTETVSLHLPPFVHAGAAFEFEPDTIKAQLEVTAMASGWALRLRFTADTTGPCARCLDPTPLELSVDGREFHDPAAGDPELLSDFVDSEHRVEIATWANLAIADEFPVRLLCSEECRGLCPVCGANRNHEQCDCVLETPDLRWEKLKEIEFQEDDAT